MKTITLQQLWKSVGFLFNFHNYFFLIDVLIIVGGLTSQNGNVFEINKLSGSLVAMFFLACQWQS